MPRNASKATADALLASPRRRAFWSLAFAVAGVAAAALVAAGQSDAQDDYPGVNPPVTTYPDTTTPTTTSPAPGPSPGLTPGTTSPAPVPSPIPRPAKGTVVIKGTSISSYRFSPRTLRIKRGKRARWSWTSNAPHNVVFRRPRKRSKTASQGRFALRFRRRGTYRYVCTVHDFGGKVVVR